MDKRMSRQKRLIIAGVISFLLIYIIFFMPLPFVSTLWEDNILRHRMTWDVSRRVVGLHEEEVIQMLGEPYTFGAMIYYRLRGPDHRWFWASFVIRLDEARIVIDTISHINPYHVGS